MVNTQQRKWLLPHRIQPRFSSWSSCQVSGFHLLTNDEGWLLPSIQSIGWRKLALATHLLSRRHLNRSDFSSRPLREKQNAWPFLFPPWPLGGFSSTVFSVLTFLHFTYATPKPWTLAELVRPVRHRRKSFKREGGKVRERSSSSSACAGACVLSITR